MLRPTALALILGAATATAAAPAMAQQGYGGAYGYYAAPAPAVPVRPGTRVYRTTPAGTTAVYVAPKNCGVYRYWDGVQCVDARTDPPPLDRERPVGW